MPSSTTRTLCLAVLLAALLAAGTLATLVWQKRQAAPQDSSMVAVLPAAPPAAAELAPPPRVEVIPPAPARAEEVPAEEAETDRGPASASPAGPTLSFGRDQGLHLAPNPLRLNSSVALVVDRETGAVLTQRNAEAVLPIASLTKLMTGIVILEAKQPMNEVLTITEEDVDTMRHSRSRLRVGTQLTREEALRLALMSSENRAAHALARAYPGGLERMVTAMNAKARQFGMHNTQFVDPTGLSNANRSTAYEVAMLAHAAAHHPMLAEFSTTRRYLADFGERQLQYINSNRLVRNTKSGWDVDLQKTGYIVEAGRCMVMVTQVAGRDVVMVLLDADSNGTRMADAQRLRRWAVAKLGGGEEDTAVAAEPVKPRKVAAASPKKKKASNRPVASVRDKKGQTRIRQTFAAAKPSSKS